MPPEERVAPVAPRVIETKRVYSGWNKLDVITVEAADADGALRDTSAKLSTMARRRWCSSSIANGLPLS